MRFLGVEMRETELMAISNAFQETLKEYPSGWFQSSEKLAKIAEMVIKFGDIVMANGEQVLDSNPKTLRRILSQAGAEEHKAFFETFLEQVSKRKALVKMLSGFSTVSVGTGSILVKFRNRMGKVQELKINLAQIWGKVKEREQAIKNSFQHFGELVKETADQTIVHIGIYGAAFALIITSLWFSVAYDVASGLVTIASSLVNTLKAAFPILSFIVWLLCSFLTIVEGYSKAQDAFEALKKFLAQ